MAEQITRAELKRVDPHHGLLRIYECNFDATADQFERLICRIRQQIAAAPSNIARLAAVGTAVDLLEGIIVEIDETLRTVSDFEERARDADFEALINSFQTIH